MLDSILTPFQYRKLSDARDACEIRFLTLFPADGSQTIRCRIGHGRLDDENGRVPEYEALSYCWGAEEPKQTIIVYDDKLDKRKFEVTVNLYQALQRLEPIAAPRTLWVDAVCINQRDKQEKDVQVAMMRDIYSRASRTVVWLGPGSDKSDDALALVPQLIRARELDAQENTERNLWAVDGDRGGLPEAHQSIWYDFFDVLKRDWFYRAWIVQEVVVAARVTVLCGDVELEWDALVQVVNYIVEAGGLGLTLGMNALEQLQTLDSQRSRYREGQPFDVLYVLMQNRKSLAKYPVDHIFAFHGFFEPGSFGQDLTTPRYQLEAKVVYTGLALRLLQMRRDLDIFSVPRLRRHTSDKDLHGLPTWVPDWSAGDHCEPFLWRNIHPDFATEQKVTYRASGNSSYDLAVQDRGQKLKIVGWILEEVDGTGPVNEPPADHVILDDLTKMCAGIIHTQKVFGSWEFLAGLNNRQSSYATGETVLDAYRQTLLGGCTWGFEPHALSILFNMWLASMFPFRVLQLLRLDRVWLLKAWLVLKGLFFWLFAGILQLKSVQNLIQVNSSDGLIRTMMTHIGNRRLIRTDNGLIGLAPMLTEPGDVIALCRGGKLPLILRPRGKNWELIGDCYVHGLMDGRLWNMLEGNAGCEGSFWEQYRAKCKRFEFWLV